MGKATKRGFKPYGLDWLEAAKNLAGNPPGVSIRYLNVLEYPVSDLADCLEGAAQCSSGRALLRYGSVRTVHSATGGHSRGLQFPLLLHSNSIGHTIAIISSMHDATMSPYPSIKAGLWHGGV
jgi:hypothetical protein